MDNFNIPHQRVTEKSVYMLHLDTARIILISAGVIGIVIVSFLLGMNFIKKGDGSQPLTTRNDVFDGAKELDLLKNNIPDTSDEEEPAKSADEKASGAEKDEKARSAPEARNEKTVKQKTEQPELLTGDTIRGAEKPEKETGKKTVTRNSGETVKRQVSDDEEVVEKAAPRKAAAKNVSRRKKGGKSKVLAVSGDARAERNDGAEKRYSIQIASFDRKSKAQAELKSLKEMKYDAYVDEKRVNGRQYFRVRIGPLAGKKKALDMLKNLQGRDRYQECYMIHD